MKKLQDGTDLLLTKVMQIAQYNLGLQCTSQGLGVPQDYAEAVRWYRLAADQGCAMRNSILDHVRMGQGVLQDYAEAVSGTD
jgi:TPR repeat protein